MSNNQRIFFKGIEKKIIEEINHATKSIKIAMAWFTCKEIKDSLIELKKRKQNIQIEIVVDSNDINENYFYDYRVKFNEHEIIIKEKSTRVFLHYKFIVIDEFTTINGSYNLTAKARKNLEHISICKSKRIASHFSRMFSYITTKDYVDENIRLLFEYPEFAIIIISTYYDFNKTEYLKYKDKIEYGYCFTVDNGFSDQIQYGAGLVFNSKIKYCENFESEFSLPIDKEFIKNWISNRNEGIIIHSYCQDKLFNLINGEIKKNRKKIEDGFKRQFDNLYSYEELKIKIENNINIIIEDEIWSTNFEPFINKQLIYSIFQTIRPLPEDPYFSLFDNCLDEQKPERKKKNTA